MCLIETKICPHCNTRLVREEVCYSTPSAIRNIPTTALICMVCDYTENENKILE